LESEECGVLDFSMGDGVLWFGSISCLMLENCTRPLFKEARHPAYIFIF